MKPAIRQDGARAIHGIAFADLAEVRYHAFSPQEGRYRVIIQFKFAIINQPSAASYLCWVRNRVVFVLIVELPKTGHHPPGHIEFSLGPFTDLMRGSQQI